MFSFTKQERLLLIVLAIVIFAGASLQLAFKKYPSLGNLVNLVDSDKLYSKVNINTATSAELEAIPYIGVYTSESIVEYRKQNGPFENLVQLMKVKGIREKNFERFKNYLKIE